MSTPPQGAQHGSVTELDRVTIRFAGDSGDGMQLTGSQFTATTALFGNDVSTLPDYPAEIRAPAGSLPGVSGFQISFSSDDIHTPGDRPDVLVAMNPAALKVNLGDLVPGGGIIVNTDAFNEINLKKAGYAADPLHDGSLKGYNLFEIPMSTLVAGACDGLGLTSKQVELTKNFFALGVMFWLYERSMEATERWIAEKFSGKDAIAEANRRALRAGYAFGETTEIFHTHFRVPPAHLPPGTYRNITGNEATALGFVVAAKLAERDLFLASYPITPASDILHQLSSYKHLGVKTVQSEDEIAAIGAAVGAAYGGALGMTTTSGPGMALKAEMLGLAVMVELPLVVVDVQRAGPSTGMPTKTEQGDLLMSMFGRNSDSPIPVIAPATPAECFDMAIEAWRIALKHMTPVVYLSDAFLATGAYGHPMAKVHGAPLRLAVPWKYGFKSIKSIVKIAFTDKRPQTFWETTGPREYGFWANVNPKVSHPRWSQAVEKVLGTGDRRPTQIYNGYGDYVADLYKGLEKENLFM